MTPSRSRDSVATEVQIVMPASARSCRPHHSHAGPTNHDAVSPCHASSPGRHDGPAIRVRMPAPSFMLPPSCMPVSSFIFLNNSTRQASSGRPCRPAQPCTPRHSPACPVSHASPPPCVLTQPVTLAPWPTRLCGGLRRLAKPSATSARRPGAARSATPQAQTHATAQAAGSGSAGSVAHGVAPGDVAAVALVALDARKGQQLRREPTAGVSDGQRQAERRATKKTGDARQLMQRGRRPAAAARTRATRARIGGTGGRAPRPGSLRAVHQRQHANAHGTTLCVSCSALCVSCRVYYW